nr:calmodulin-binding protein [Tanacetum cinerariifolium]
SPINAIEPCKKTSLQLRFVAKLPNTIFTGSQIQSEDNTAVKLVIREARSQAVIVKDQRGESYKKHHPPYLVDEIWRLEKIAKDGILHKRLATYRICTVKDFLQMYATNQSLLRKLLGGSSNKTWETVIKHAKDCVLDDKLYMYRSSEDAIGLLLDSVLTVVGATFDGQNYQPLDKLSVYQMPIVEASKQKVYKNLNGMVPIDESSVFGVPVLKSMLLHQDHLKSEIVDIQGVNIPLLQQDEHETHMHGVADSGSETEIGVGYDPSSMDYFSSALRNSFVFKEFSSGNYDQDDLVADIGTSLWHGNGLFIDTSNRTIDIVSSDFGISFSRNRSPRARWCKIRAALKWGSVRRDDVESSKEQWDSLEAKYMLKDASSKKFLDSDKPKSNNVFGPLVVNMVKHNNFIRMMMLSSGLTHEQQFTCVKIDAGSRHISH